MGLYYILCNMCMCLYSVCRFNCGRWLARAEDDGSVERFLVSEKVPQTISKSCTISALGTSAVVTMVFPSVRMIIAIVLSAL